MGTLSSEIVSTIWSSIHVLTLWIFLDCDFIKYVSDILAIRICAFLTILVKHHHSLDKSQQYELPVSYDTMSQKSRLPKIQVTPSMTEYLYTRTIVYRDAVCVNESVILDSLHTSLVESLLCLAAVCWSRFCWLLNILSGHFLQ